MIRPAATVPPSDIVGRYGLSNCEGVSYLRGFVDDPDAVEQCLRSGIGWREESLLIFGRHVTVPRLCAWYGDRGVTYRFSHTSHRANAWPPAVAKLRDALHARLGIRFNFVLANLYRDGNDAMGWHADDERELGEFPCIASLSFGASRRFCLRDRGPECRRTEVVLESGSLLLMWGTSQRDWQHSIPRTRATVGPRINLTFRTVETDS